MLTAYPAAQKFLDFKALDLQNFLPGASIFKEGKENQIGDPLRDFSLLFQTVFSSLIPLKDKVKILQLNIQLKKKEITAIFEEKEKTTLQYLQDFGFSDEVITQFFKPFFSGIFLETQLETSSRMFEFVYKMFGTGNGAVPKAGIQAIPDQLKNQLKTTEILFNTKAKSVIDGQITSEDGTILESDFTIIATDSTALLSKSSKKSIKWKSCFTLYFETEKRVIAKPLIGLLPEENSLINNLFYTTSLKTALNGGKELLCITVIDNHGLKGDELTQKVKSELKEHFNIDVLRWIKTYEIPKALPDLKEIKYTLTATESRYSEKIFLAGDTLVNGSLNAAMLSGEHVALEVIKTINGRI